MSTMGNDNTTAEDVEQLLRCGLEKALRLGATAAALGFERDERIGCAYEAGRLKDTGAQQHQGYWIMAVVNQRMSTLRGNILERFDVMVERAVEFARSGSNVHFEAYPPPASVVPVRLWSERTASLPREKLIEGCDQIVQRLKDYGHDLFIVGEAARTETESFLVTSGGVSHRQRSTAWELGAYVQRTEGTDILYAWHDRRWRDLNEFFDPSAVAEHILTDVRHAERIAPPLNGSVPVLFSPEMVAQLLYPVMVGVNGRTVARNESPLVGRVGEQILAPTLTILDDPHVDFAFGACALDRSGIPTRRQVIFDRGVLQGFLYDLDSAALAGARPTGNDGCRPYNLRVEPGPRSSRQLLRTIEDGIYVKNLMAFFTCNHMNGDFSCNVGLGYRVRKGEIVGRVKDTMAAGNVYKLLGGNVERSSDLSYDGRFPYLLAEGLHLSCRS